MQVMESISTLVTKVMKSATFLYLKSTVSFRGVWLFWGASVLYNLVLVMEILTRYFSDLLGDMQDTQNRHLTPLPQSHTLY